VLLHIPAACTFIFLHFANRHFSPATVLPQPKLLPKSSVMQIIVKLLSGRNTMLEVEPFDTVEVRQPSLSLEPNFPVTPSRG
jgi:hypothetical protein